MPFVCLLVAAAVLVQPPDPLRIEIREGNGAIAARNALSARRFVVAVIDSTGRPVPRATVRFRLPADGPSGTFSSGMRSETILTGDDGQAWVQGIQWNDFPGPLQLRIIAETGERSAEAVINIEISTTAKPETIARRGSSGKKWLVIAAAGAGAAAALALAGRGSSGPASPTTPAVSIVPPTIGTPTFTIGKP